MGLVRKIVFVIALMVFVGSGGALLLHYLEGAREQQALVDLIPSGDEEEGIQTDKGYVIPKYAGLYKLNKDIIGWVQVKGTHINYPVMQTQDDPEFYLRRDFNKEYAVSGVPFLDAKSDIFIPTANWLIYGHHMQNGTMFHDLLNYMEKDFYKKHKTFRFDTIYEGGQAEYEVVAAFQSQIYPEDKDVFKYYTYAGMTSKSEFEYYVSGIKGLSKFYDTGITPKFGDQLVTLSTCSYHVPGKVGRFAVVGRRID